ncbi:hypothetical protein BO85DRAFT_368840, partial [Aspergillus piperis CBS 112811]
AHTTTGCGKQGFPSAQPYLSHTPGANPFCCMFLPFLWRYIILSFTGLTNVSVHSCLHGVGRGLRLALEPRPEERDSGSGQG